MPLFTVTEESTAEIIIRRSRFLAHIAPADSKENAQEYLSSLKHRHWDAVHHCYAYRVGDDGLEYRMSDDGEPSGTAGKPILFALQQASLTNVILVVVRYFGGVKLGVGPLARAYADSAKMAIDEAVLRELIPTERLTIFCEYDDVSRVIDLLQEVKASYQQHFADAVSFDVELPAKDVDFLTEQVIERTSARAGFSKVAP